MKIWAQTLVKNEERYLWFAVMSVVEYVDKVMLWDTGSTDKTGEIIKDIKKRYPNKILYRQVGEVNADSFTQVRQEMLEETKADWFLIVDGDEVWWDSAIENLTSLIKKEGGNLDSIVCRYQNLVGDIYHYQTESAGLYQIDEKEGHLTIRAINMKIPGLFVSKPHGQQGFFDKNNTLIQERDRERRRHLEGVSYLHFTHMTRSSSVEIDRTVMKRDIKYKYELGIKFPQDYYYPEVFFRPRPTLVPLPWARMKQDFMVRALLLSLPRKVRRMINRGTTGY